MTYNYDGFGRRRSAAVSGGATTTYRYDAGWNVLNEVVTGGTKTYVHGPARMGGSTCRRCGNGVRIFCGWRSGFSRSSADPALGAGRLRELPEAIRGLSPEDRARLVDMLQSGDK